MYVSTRKNLKLNNFRDDQARTVTSTYKPVTKSITLLHFLCNPQYEGGTARTYILRLCGI